MTASSATKRPATCPAWCQLKHGVTKGEDDTVHVSDYVPAGKTFLRLCATIDPTTREQEGPYVLLGIMEFNLEQAEELLQGLGDLLVRGKAEAMNREPHAVLPIQGSGSRRDTHV